jgi:methionyl-tRNA formyltransferase
LNTINRVLFMGSKQLGLRILQEMHALSPSTLVGVVTLDDAADKRTRLDAIREFARENGLPLHIARDRRHSERIIAEMRPDLCLVYNWYWLLSDAAILSAPAGFLGIHNSALPSYRGGSPVVWAIINGEAEVGFSLFAFTPGMDDGPILARGSVPVGPGDYIADVLCKLEDEIVTVFRRTYPAILDGTAARTEQAHEFATYCAARDPDDGNIDWSLPAREVFNFVRGQSEPYPGAFTYLNGSRLTVWSAEVFDKKYFGTPGQVAQIGADGVYVICGGHTALVLHDVELDGQRGRAGDFVRSIRTRLSRTPAA